MLHLVFSVIFFAMNPVTTATTSSLIGVSIAIHKTSYNYIQCFYVMPMAEASMNPGSKLNHVSENLCASRKLKILAVKAC